MSLSRLSTGAALLGLAICLTVIVSYEAVLPLMSSWLNVGEEPDCADHVLVLPGDPTYRPLVAAALVNAGLARNVLVPETFLPSDVRDGLSPPEATVLRMVLEHRGIPAQSVMFLKGASRTTWSDARLLQDFLKDRPQDRVIVVTNAFHTRRARFTFRRVLDAEAERLRFVAAPNPGFADDDWWKHRGSASAVLSENFKLLFYVVRYSTVRIWISIVLLFGILWLLHRRQIAYRPGPVPPTAPAPTSEPPAA